MADWTDPPWAQLVAGKAWTDEKAAAAFENVIAQAEGAPDAPKNLGKSMDIDIGNMTGTTAIVDLDDAAKVLLVATATHAPVPASAAREPSIGYQLSSDNGSSWGGAVVIAASKMNGDSTTVYSLSATGVRIIDMTGYNAIRLSGTGTLNGSLIWVEGA